MKSNAVKIIRRLREHGHEAYLVGGCVRDLLLGRRPRDYDVATSARPEKIVRLFRKTIPVGAKFGVILVRLRGRSYEVATFREDLGYEDGRHPSQVRFSTAEADARRRDFTINGMFYDPDQKRVIDFVDGKRDLTAGVIRTIGSPRARFKEDKLRLLRAIRFSARFGFPIEPATGSAIRRLAPAIIEVSAERIRDELMEILMDQRPAEGLRLMDRYGLLKVILPEVHAMKGVKQPPEFHPEGDVFTHTLLMLEKMKRSFAWKPEFALAVLLHDAGKPPTYREADRIRFDNHTVVGEQIAAELMRRLRFSRQEIKLVSELVREHMHFMSVREMRPSTLKKFLRKEKFDLHLELHRLDCAASHGDLTNYRFCKKRLAELGREKKVLRPPRLLTGYDLINLGLEPGPRFRKILAALEDAQLEGVITTRDEAIRFVRDNYLGPT